MIYKYPLQSMALCYEYLIPLIIISTIIAICLPLLPNRKLRYYTCYISYLSVTSVVCFLLLPVGILRPMNIANLNLSANLQRHFTRILGIKWELKNGETLKEDKGAVIVSNHQTILDIMGMYNIWYLIGKLIVVAKKELLYFFPVGLYWWLSGLIFINRMDTKSAKDKINASAKLIQHRKVKLWIFPEGKRNKDGNGILPFKKGAFRIAIESQVPIIPIVYSPYYFIDTEKKTFSKGKVIISVLEPIPTKGLTPSDTDLLKDKTYKLMSNEYEKLQSVSAGFQRVD